MNDNSNYNFVVYNTADLMKIFHCSKNIAYKLMSSEDFPSVKVGERLYVEHDALKEWFKGDKK